MTTGVCIVRVEAHGTTSWLYTVIRNPDIAAGDAVVVESRHVAMAEALAAVRLFLEQFGHSQDGRDGAS